MASADNLAMYHHQFDVGNSNISFKPIKTCLFRMLWDVSLLRI